MPPIAPDRPRWWSLRGASRLLAGLAVAVALALTGAVPAATGAPDGHLPVVWSADPGDRITHHDAGTPVATARPAPVDEDPSAVADLVATATGTADTTATSHAISARPPLSGSHPDAAASRAPPRR